MANENQYDAIVIGAGVIGAAIGYELSKLGRRTLNIDKLPAAGYGSTSNTCAIIRFSYLSGTFFRQGGGRARGRNIIHRSVFFCSWSTSCQEQQQTGGTKL